MKALVVFGTIGNVRLKAPVADATVEAPLAVTVVPISVVPVRVKVAAFVMNPVPLTLTVGAVESSVIERDPVRVESPSVAEIS